MNLSLFAQPWAEIFQQNNALNQSSSYDLVKKQYQAFVAGDAPVVANPIIKQIIIEENHEPLITVDEQQHPRIMMLPQPANNQSFLSPDCNSGLPAAAKLRQSVWVNLVAMVAHLDELAPLFGYTPGKVHIKIFEGLRDLATQKKLFDAKMADIQKANPALSAEQAATETAKWVSPYVNNVPVHSTGAAVDVRLWNEEMGNFIDLGPFGVIWGTNQNAPTFSENLTDAQKHNRLYLMLAAAKAGLVNYPYEYWHFSTGDRYAAYWQQDAIQLRKALYGPIE